jgi:hypothetical protein
MRALVLRLGKGVGFAQRVVPIVMRELGSVLVSGRVMTVPFLSVCATRFTRCRAAIRGSDISSSIAGMMAVVATASKDAVR